MSKLKNHPIIEFPFLQPTCKNENDLTNFLPSDLVYDIDNDNLNKNASIETPKKIPFDHEKSYHFVAPNKHKSENILDYSCRNSSIPVNFHSGRQFTNKNYSFNNNQSCSSFNNNHLNHLNFTNNLEPTANFPGNFHQNQQYQLFNSGYFQSCSSQTNKLINFYDNNGQGNINQICYNNFHEGNINQFTFNQNTYGANIPMNNNQDKYQNLEEKFKNRQRPKTFFSADQIKLAENHKKNITPSSICQDQKQAEENLSFEQILSLIETSFTDFVKTQRGSRLLQKYLNKAIPEEIDYILKELGESLGGLMMDPYSNYMCQRLAQCCSSDQRIVFLKKILKDFTEISCNKKGTYALQAIIEILNLKEEEEIVNEEVKNNLLKLALDQNGTHVIQRILTCFEESQRDGINQEILKNFLTLVMDSNGICIIKDLIANNISQDFRIKILQIITENCLEIIQNPYGNYAIQEVFDKWGAEASKDIVNIIKNNISSLSIQKYSSNVVEKTIDILEGKQKKSILTDILVDDKNQCLIKNKFGKFVLLKAVRVAKNCEILKNEIRETLNKKIREANSREKQRINQILEMVVN